ncbi:GvpL/GvpF family gas vesicle protein, partial [Candidatus Hakubella thermalkaliphila]
MLTEGNQVTEKGKYIYCIIGINEDRNFGSMGIGGRGDEVYTVCYQDLAAVISDSPIMKYP